MKPDLPKQEEEEERDSNKLRPPSSSSSAPQKWDLSASSLVKSLTLPKKFRDLPNLSECHACGFRIDVTNGRKRLQTLYSEWRIVLLCKKCFSRVESSVICSYCFAETLGDCFCCCQCNRRVHSECVFQYRSVAPWSFSCSGSDFSVCVDCWVPKHVVVDGGDFRSRKIRRKTKVGSDSGRSRVSDGKHDAKFLEGVRKDANSVADKKVEAVMDLLNNASGLIAEREGNGSAETGVVAGDAELAFKLHQAMNSSQRILKKVYSANSSCLATPRRRKSDERDLTIQSLPGKCNALNKFHENPDKNQCQVNCEAEDENVELPTKEGQGSCSVKLINLGSDENSLDSESLSCHKRAENTKLENERYNWNFDRYFFKYRRRDTTDRYFSKYRRRDRTGRYALKYSKRNTRLKNIPVCGPKIFYDHFCLGDQDFSAGLLLSYSEESGTISNASFGSSAVPLRTIGL